MRRAAAVLLCVALLALPVVPSISASSPSAASSATYTTELADLSSNLPAALAQPWAARSGYEATYLAESTDVGPSTSPSVSVMVTFWPRDLSFFSPATGALPLSTDQILAEYAPSPTQYGAVVAYFIEHNLTIQHAWADHLSLTVQGSAAAVGTAFGTELVNAMWAGRAVQMPVSVPSLPASLEPLISSVSGLSSGFTDFTVPLAPASLPRVIPGRTSSLVSPSDVHQLYDLDGLYNYSGTAHWATGIGIALVLWGEGFAPSDIQSFFAGYYPAGFPPIEYGGYPVDGAPAPSANAVNDPSNVTSEMTLDMEWAGSAAPGATISAVYAPDGPAKDNYSPSDAGLEDALNYAIQSIAGVRVVSMSFGTPDGSDPSFQTAFTEILADAATRGITALAASGDTGGTARLGCQGGPSPEFPAVSQYVVAVGGTAPVLSVDTFGTVTGLASEPVWNRSGGGFSTTVKAPVWQLVGSAAAPIEAGGGRGIPDVSGPANDNVFFYNGAEAAGAGTSFASPMWAGIFAEMDAIRGTPLGLVTPRLYAVGSAEENRSAAIGLVAITQGSNCVTQAATGWDAATGWGSPRALALYQDLSGTFVNVSLTTSASSVAPGQSFDASVAVTNATSLAPVGGASVTFALDSVNYVGPCGGSIATTTGATASTGNASSSLTVPGCYLGLEIQITATVSGGQFFGSNVTTVHVNLLGLAGFLAIVQVFPYNFISFGAIMLVAVLIGWRVGNWRDRRRRAALQRSNGGGGAAGGAETDSAGAQPPDASGPSPLSAAGQPAASMSTPPFFGVSAALASTAPPAPMVPIPLDVAPTDEAPVAATEAAPVPVLPATVAAVVPKEPASSPPELSPLAAVRPAGDPPRRPPAPRPPPARATAGATGARLTGTSRVPARKPTSAPPRPAAPAPPKGAPPPGSSMSPNAAPDPMLAVCPACGALPSQGATACGNCGASLA
jgi:kumamolisin